MRYPVCPHFASGEFEHVGSRPFCRSCVWINIELYCLFFRNSLDICDLQNQDVVVQHSRPWPRDSSCGEFQMVYPHVESRSTLIHDRSCDPPKRVENPTLGDMATRECEDVVEEAVVSRPVNRICLNAPSQFVATSNSLPSSSMGAVTVASPHAYGKAS